MDRIDRLDKKLQEIKDAFDTWQNSGLNPEVMKIYIRMKTKIGKKTLDEILFHQKEFFDNLMREEVVKRLDGDGDNQTEQN